MADRRKGIPFTSRVQGIPFPSIHFLILSCLCRENREDPESRVACHGTRTAGSAARFLKFTYIATSTVAYQLTQERNFRKGSWKESIHNLSRFASRSHNLLRFTFNLSNLRVIRRLSHFSHSDHKSSILSRIYYEVVNIPPRRKSF